MSAELAETAKAGETKRDADTGIDWTRASIELWTARTNLVGDLKALWAYGAEMYESACGACHSATPLGHFPANQWAGVINDMKPQTALDEEEARFLQLYVQNHAQDVAGAH
jgi:trimethylamine-N-oxide reductase cytochrome c-type subunit TorC